MTNTAKTYTDSLELDYSAEFVPQSRSRNAASTDHSINWRVTISKGGHSLTTDYMQGVGHLPRYSHQFSRLAVYDDAVREACETGETKIREAKNGYDACQGRPAAIPQPKLVDVLYSLVTDSDVLNHPKFEEWASGFGYDPDSRSALKIYHQCLEHALTLRHIVDIDAARDAFQDY